MDLCLQETPSAMPRGDLRQDNGFLSPGKTRSWGFCGRRLIGIETRFKIHWRGASGCWPSKGLRPLPSQRRMPHHLYVRI